MEISPYYNLEVEAALIGSIFLDEELIKDCTLTPQHFYTVRLRNIFTYMKNLVQKGKPIDMISVVEEAGPQRIESIGGYSYIAALSGSVPSTANFHYYEERMKKYYQKRKMVEIAHRMKERAELEDVETLLHECILDLQQIADQSTLDEDTGDIKKALINLYHKFSKDVGEIVGIPSGFRSLDRLTGGFQESDLFVIGARPSMGKTAFALNIALEAAKEDVALVFSMEMGKEQLMARAIGGSEEINSMKLKNPYRLFQERDWEKCHQAMGTIWDLDLHVFERGGMDIPYIASKVRKFRRKYGKEKRILVVIDYLQLIVGDPRLKGNRQGEISEISRALKVLAKDQNVVIIALSQLNRAVESRQDKRPMLADLRESGQIEQDADVIAFLYRDDYYNPQSEQKNQVEVIIAKHRNGPIGTVHLAFHKEIGKFRDLQREKVVDMPQISNKERAYS